MFDQYWFYVILGIIFSCLLQFIFYTFATPKLDFKGTDVIALNSNYEMKSFKATYLGKDITKDVVIDGKVDTTKPGEYDVSYIIKIGSNKIVKHHIIKVVDKTPPALTLLGNNSVSVCVGANYTEEGFTAIDNYDNDITNKVTKQINDNKITYSVVDSSGNKTTISRVIKYEDILAPTITLNGSNKIYLYVGSSYKESGYTANDNCDGNITSKVSVSGSVNINVTGSYQIKYTITDVSGLSTTVMRTIHVINKPDNSGKTIYLTFDDGPSNVTSSILDILKDEGVKATFFVINRDDSLNYLIAKEYNEGHTVALHSYNHNYSKIYTSDAAYFEDLNAISNKVKSITGAESKIIRFPGGSSNIISSNYNIGIMSRLATELTNRGYIYQDWNVGSTDTQAIGSDLIYSNVISRLSSGSTSIVLMHDAANNWQSVNALKRIIQYGKQMGYSFNRITTSTPVIHHRIAN